MFDSVAPEVQISCAAGAPISARDLRARLLDARSRRAPVGVLRGGIAEQARRSVRHSPMTPRDPRITGVVAA